MSEAEEPGIKPRAPVQSQIPVGWSSAYPQCHCLTPYLFSGHPASHRKTPTWHGRCAGHELSSAGGTARRCPAGTQWSVGPGWTQRSVGPRAPTWGRGLVGTSCGGACSPLVREPKRQLVVREWGSLLPSWGRVSPGDLQPARSGSDAEASSFSLRSSCSWGWGCPGGTRQPPVGSAGPFSWGPLRGRTLAFSMKRKVTTELRPSGATSGLRLPGEVRLGAGWPLRGVQGAVSRPPPRQPPLPKDPMSVGLRAKEPVLL